MKKAFPVRLFSILLVFGLLFSMYACSPKSEAPESKSQTDTKTVTTSEELTTTVEQSYDPLGKYEPAITLTSVRDTITDIKFPEGDDLGNNVWTREIEDVLGIKIKYLWTVDMSQYTNKLNVTIASGEIPDFFQCSADVLSTLAETGQLADLTDVYEKYSTPEFKATMDAFPEGFESAKYNGKLSGISAQGYGVISMPMVVWIRDDWMKKFSLTPPESMADLEKMAEIFVTKDPDGNSKNDTYGVAIYKDYFGGLESIEGIANAHHAYPQIWVKNAAGEIEYGSIQPEMKNVLQTLQNWYKKGILSKEFGTKDVNKCNEDLVSGKVGIEFGACWNCYWPFPDLVNQDVNAIFKPYAIPSVDGEAVKLEVGWPVPNYYVVSKKCANPEAVIKLCNLYNKYIYHGTQEQYYKFNTTQEGEGRSKFTPIYPSDPNTDYNKHVLMVEALKSNDVSKLNVESKAQYDSIRKWIDNKDPAGYGTCFQLSSEGSYSVLKKFVDENRVVITELRGTNTPTMAEKNATLLKLEQDAYTKIILGGSIDYFEEFVDNWNKLGGEQITKEMNEMYNK